MNVLQKFLAVTRGSEAFYLDRAAGRWISDQCLTAAEVAPQDAERAVVGFTGRSFEKWLKWWNAGNQHGKPIEEYDL